MVTIDSLHSWMGTGLDSKRQQTKRNRTRKSSFRQTVNARQSDGVGARQGGCGSVGVFRIKGGLIQKDGLKEDRRIVW